MNDSVPPEPGSAFSADLDTGQLDGYYTREWLIAECMAWLGHTKPRATEYVDEDPERALEAVITTIRS